MDEELDKGMISLAVPIRDSKFHAVIAALSVSSFTVRQSLDELVEKALPVLLEQADRIGRAM